VPLPYIFELPPLPFAPVFTTIYSVELVPPDKSKVTWYESPRTNVGLVQESATVEPIVCAALAPTIQFIPEHVPKPVNNSEPKVAYSDLLVSNSDSLILSTLTISVPAAL